MEERFNRTGTLEPQKLEFDATSQNTIDRLIRTRQLQTAQIGDTPQTAQATWIHLLGLATSSCSKMQIRHKISGKSRANQSETTRSMGGDFDTSEV
jgi:hypothetical protein